MEKEFSIVVPVYYNGTTLQLLMRELNEEVLLPAKGRGWNGVVYFVDDGSGDNSYLVLKDLKAQYADEIRVIKLSRNFGQVNAILCGLSFSKGPTVTISADGQDPVKVIMQMLGSYFEKGNEVVIAKRVSRDETLWRRSSSRIVYWVMQKLSNKDMPVGGFDFTLLGPRAKMALLRNWQPHTFLQARILDLGFKRDWIGYHRGDRKGGTSRWTFAKKFTYMLDGVLGHSYLPIRAISVLGCVFSMFSFLLGCFFFVNYFVNHTAIRGWTPIVLLILFVGGVQMIMTGVLGEYLWRVLAQTRATTPFIVEEEL